MAHTTDDLEFAPSSGTVFADMELPDADELFVKAQLAHSIRERLYARGRSAPEAALLLRSDRATVTRLMDAAPLDLSYDQLLRFLHALECDVEIRISESRIPAPSRTLVATG